MKLKGFKNITNMSHMFNGCTRLISISIIPNNNNTNFIDKNYTLTKNCIESSLKINNIIDMSNMFYGCNSLISIPDISK